MERATGVEPATSSLRCWLSEHPNPTSNVKRETNDGEPYSHSR